MERNADWQAVERSPEFRELLKRRNPFLTGVTVVWVTVFTVYLLMAALAPETMGERVLGVTFGFLFSLVQVFMTWTVTWLYLRKADRVFEPLEQRAARAPGETGRDLCCWLATLATSEPEAERRFDELYVLSETGYGAEAAQIPAEPPAAEQPVAAR
jgi:uncharacterized membrane protein (DUF485 family)